MPHHYLDSLKTPLQDTELLNCLDMLPKVGKGWIFRKSPHGRGWRLHQSTRDECKPTVREAIIAGLESNQGDY